MTQDEEVWANSEFYFTCKEDHKKPSKTGVPTESQTGYLQENKSSSSKGNLGNHLGEDTEAIKTATMVLRLACR